MKKYTNLYSKTLHKDNGLPYGKGFLEVQITKGLVVKLTDGSKYLHIIPCDSVYKAKMVARAMITDFQGVN